LAWTAGARKSLLFVRHIPPWELLRWTWGWLRARAGQ